MAEVDERPRHAGRASEDGEDEEPGDEEDEDVGGPHPGIHEPLGVLVQIRRRHRLRVQLRHPCRSSRSASRPQLLQRGGGLGLAGGRRRDIYGAGRLACGGAGQSRGRRRFVQRWGRKKNCEAGGDRRGEESRQGGRGRRWLEETVGVPPRPPAIGSNPVDGSGSWAPTGPDFFNWLAQLWALLVLPSREIFCALLLLQLFLGFLF
jgi:hypothetical protein